MNIGKQPGGEVKTPILKRSRNHMKKLRHLTPFLTLKVWQEAILPSVHRYTAFHFYCRDSIFVVHSANIRLKFIGGLLL